MIHVEFLDEVPTDGIMCAVNMGYEVLPLTDTEFYIDEEVIRDFELFGINPDVKLRLLNE